MKSYSVNRDDPKILTTGTHAELLEALSKDKEYNQLFF